MSALSKPLGGMMWTILFLNFNLKHGLGDPTTVWLKKINKKKRKYSWPFICCYLRAWAEEIFYFSISSNYKNIHCSQVSDFTLAWFSFLYHPADAFVPLPVLDMCLSLVCHLVQLCQNIFQFKFLLLFPSALGCWQLQQINEAWKGWLLCFVKSCHRVLGR